MTHCCEHFFVVIGQAWSLSYYWSVFTCWPVIFICREFEILQTIFQAYRSFFKASSSRFNSGQCKKPIDVKGMNAVNVGLSWLCVRVKWFLCDKAVKKNKIVQSFPDDGFLCRRKAPTCENFLGRQITVFKIKAMWIKKSLYVLKGSLFSKNITLWSYGLICDMICNIRGNNHFNIIILIFILKHIKVIM